MYFNSLKLDVEVEDNSEDELDMPNVELEEWDSN